MRANMAHIWEYSLKLIERDESTTISVDTGRRVVKGYAHTKRRWSREKRSKDEHMNIERIKAARAAAQEFLERADKCLLLGESLYLYPSKASGALRRQSMELTRALAEMRRN